MGFHSLFMSRTVEVFEDTIKTDHKVITEEDSKTILKRYGISVPPFALVNSVEEAAKAAKRIGFPLVMKVVSPQILKHLTTCTVDFLKRKASM